MHTGSTEGNFHEQLGALDATGFLQQSAANGKPISNGLAVDSIKLRDQRGMARCLKNRPASQEAGLVVSTYLLLGQCVNQAIGVRAAPAGGQIVAFCRREAVTADGDVVEVGLIA